MNTFSNSAIAQQLFRVRTKVTGKLKVRDIWGISVVRFVSGFHTLHGSHSVFGYPNIHVSEWYPVPIDSDRRRSTVCITERARLKSLFEKVFGGFYPSLSLSDESIHRTKKG
ncbi:hypothetical protein TNCV_843431 [Trichonephila clavipes]|nr:hypothetical protein TNCV_843431 [Trichonephila clavipes]